MVVRVTVFGATGGASKASDKCSFAKVVEMERVDATGGASSSPTKNEGDSADAKQTVLWKEVSEVVIFEG